MAERGKNKANVLGRLGGNPEIRYTTDGIPVANFSLATSDDWKNKDGQKQEKTEWHRIVVWGPLAEEVVKKYLKKGSRIDIEGKLETREWEKDGQTHHTTEIILDQFQGSILMLEHAKNDENSDSDDSALKQAS